MHQSLIPLNETVEIMEVDRQVPQHPKWYFPLFETIFAATRDYGGDISLVNEVTPIAGQVVEEIGSGTGNHVWEILKYSPQAVSAVDVDREATSLLHDRYHEFPNVSVVLGDGFSRSSKADIIMVFFSLLQQSATSDEMYSRLANLVRRTAASNGTALIEFLDIKQYEEDFADSTSKRIYNDGQNWLDIKTTYDPIFQIEYSGVVWNERANYVVRFLPLDITKVKAMSSQHKLESVVVDLQDGERRRKLLIFSSSPRMHVKPFERNV